ncbi:MAG: hypothetical protein ABS79_02800 [Planctomycetes bacterium SCN 63-9]|nr:MAG: hypothetical protein ABS79_02800 [Planctomycetes bacterium SCN 63-9]
MKAELATGVPAIERGCGGIEDWPDLQIPAMRSPPRAIAGARIAILVGADFFDNSGPAEAASEGRDLFIACKDSSGPEPGTTIQGLILSRRRDDRQLDIGSRSV